MQILQALASRAFQSKLPSVIKSFLLPIAYQFSKEPQPDKLMAIFDSPTDLLWKWMSYTHKFSDDSAKLSYLGLLGVLRATRLDLKIAGFWVNKGTETNRSEETCLLQTKLVHVMSEYLEYTVQDKILAEAKASGQSVSKPPPDDDYDYGDYGDDDYGMEDDGFNAALKGATEDWGGFDDDVWGGATDTKGCSRREIEENQEEERLIGHLVAPPLNSQQTKREYIGDLIKSELRQVGQKTLKMILGQE